MSLKKHGIGEIIQVDKQEGDDDEQQKTEES